jgi:predicted nucleic acid-binding protein
MKPVLVVDASVAVKWVVHEEGREAAMELLRQAAANRVRLFAPSLLLLEVGNVLWSKARRGHLTNSEADRAYEMFLTLRPRIADTKDLARTAFELAIRHDRTVYDSTYLALALALRADFVTDDRKLFRGVARALPFIRLLTATSN